MEERDRADPKAMNISEKENVVDIERTKGRPRKCLSARLCGHSLT